VPVRRAKKPEGTDIVWDIVMKPGNLTMDLLKIKNIKKLNKQIKQTPIIICNGKKIREINRSR